MLFLHQPLQNHPIIGVTVIPICLGQSHIKPVVRVGGKDLVEVTTPFWLKLVYFSLLEQLSLFACLTFLLPSSLGSLWKLTIVTEIEIRCNSRSLGNPRVQPWDGSCHGIMIKLSVVAAQNTPNTGWIMEKRKSQIVTKQYYLERDS